MRWVQLYFILGFIGATGWNLQVQRDCGTLLTHRQFLGLVAAMPIALIALIYPVPTCNKMQG